MSQVASDQTDNMEKKLRKRNIHRQDEAELDESSNSSLPSAHADSGSDNSNSFLLSKFLPKPLRQCLSGQESNKTQKMILTSTDTNTDTDTVPVPKSCSDSDLSSAYAQITDIEIKNKSKSYSSAAAARVAAGNEPYADDTSDADAPLTVSYNTCTTVSSNTSSNMSDNLDSEYDYETSDKAYSFLKFRLSYLFVTLVVMLADGLQGKDSKYVTLY